MQNSVFVAGDIYSWWELKLEPDLSQEKKLDKGQLT